MTGLEPDIYRAAATTIASWRRPLLITHTKPDGDALGSLAAMRALLSTRGAQPTVLLFDALPDRYALFQAYPPFLVLGTDVREADLDRHDGVIVLDTCALKQMEPVSAWLAATTLPKLAIDHHRTRDDLADHYLIDESAAANCLILHEWACTMRWTLDLPTCRALFVGLATDTGWFVHGNTDQRTFAAAADLVSKGVAAHELHQQLFQRDSPARVRLLGATLNTLRLLSDDRLAVMELSQAAMAGVGAGPSDTEGLVNEPMSIASVVVSALLVERPDGVVRISLRSKPPVSGAAQPSPDIDVARAAEAFGGGGHRRAAGLRIHGSLSEAGQTVVEHLTKLLDA